MQVFQTFLERAILGRHTCTRIELVLASVKGQQSVVDAVAIEDPAAYAQEDTMLALVERLAATAQADADGWGGCSRYFLRAQFGEVDATGSRSPVVRVHARDSGVDEDPGEGGEPANATGLVAQAHRHTEAVTRQLVLLTESFTRQATETMSRQAEALARAERDRMQTFELLEELASRKHERELEHAKETRREKTTAKLLEAVMPLIPSVGGKLLLGPKAPGKVTNDPAMLTLVELARTLSPQDMQGLQQVLGTERFIALLEAVQRAMPAEEGNDGEREDERSDGSDGSNGSARHGNGGGTAAGGNPWH